MTTLPLGELRSVDTADVYKGDRMAGTLRRERDDVVFRYDESYLADAGAPPLATTLPKRPEAVRATGGAVPPFFAGLLPEGLRLNAVTLAARTSSDDHLTLLLAVGADTIGDVRVAPAGAPPAEPAPVLAIDAAGIDDFREVFARATAADPDVLDRIALPGVQVKVSAQMISTPLTTTTGPAILKLNPPADPCLVENEHFFLSVAAACGIPVADHRLVHDKQGRAALLVERFDRVVAGGSLIRLPQEDACQVLDRYPAAKYRLTYEEACRALGDVVDAGGGSRVLTLRRLVEIGALSYVVGNGDLHGKNLSVRLSPAGHWELTPTYDLLSTQPYLSWRDPMALRFYGRDNELALRWWLEGATRLGVPERATRRALARIVRSLEPLLDDLGEIGFDAATTHRLRDLIAGRARELTDT